MEAQGRGNAVLPAEFSHRRMRNTIACEDQSSPGGGVGVSLNCRSRGGAAVVFASDCQGIRLSIQGIFRI